MFYRIFDKFKWNHVITFIVFHCLPRGPLEVSSDRTCWLRPTEPPRPALSSGPGRRNKPQQSYEEQWRIGSSVSDGHETSLSSNLHATDPQEVEADPEDNRNHLDQKGIGSGQMETILRDIYYYLCAKKMFQKPSSIIEFKSKTFIDEHDNMHKLGCILFMQKG